MNDDIDDIKAFLLEEGLVERVAIAICGANAQVQKIITRDDYRVMARAALAAVVAYQLE